MRKIKIYLVLILCASVVSVKFQRLEQTAAAHDSQVIADSIGKTAISDRDLANQHRTKMERLAALQAYKVLILPDTPVYARGVSSNLIRRIDTNKKVVFLTMDDGIVKNSSALDYIKTHRLNPTAFLTNDIIKDNYVFFNDYQKAGIEIQNHTLTHPKLTKLGYAAQKAEICGMSDKIVGIYAKKPTIFRPPFGEFNADTLRATQDCGMNFVVHWSAKVDGGAIQYQRGTHLVAGDIVLMHFRPMIMEDLRAFNDEVVSQGLTPAYLSDWLK